MKHATKFLIGTKKGMSQLFDESGMVTPVTVVAVPKTTITQVKSKTTDGYSAVQIGYGEQKKERVNKAQLKKGTFKGFKEFRVSEAGTEQFVVGNELNASVFKEGDTVQVSGLTKGKGFQGVVKRHGFKGGPRSHGQKHSEREPGSIGGGPGRAGGRVVRGMRMGGRMGSDRVTTTNMKIAKVDVEAGMLYIKGAVPGRPGTTIEVVQK